MVGEELKALGYATQVTVPPTYRISTPGDHHIGATRMAASPSEGYVDANCRVHGIPNLYIASSSVFPTGGYANPTLTIIALAARLADHLRGS
jgi:choline dehydrogenase-like flavoprotein